MATATNITIKERLGEIDWARLEPGTVVTAPWRADPSGNSPDLAYREKVLLSGVGITLRSTPGPNGQIPTIDGENATTDPQFNSGTYRPIEDSGLVTIYRRPGGPRPSGITIEGFRIRGASSQNADPTYTAFDGTRRTYGDAAAGIYGVEGDDITVRGCELFDNCNGGLVVGSKGCKRWVWEDLKIYRNGRKGSNKQHNLYVEVLGGVIYRRIKFGALVDGALGGDLKDRSCGAEAEDVECSGFAARNLDWSAPDESWPLAVLDPLFLVASVKNCYLPSRTGGAGALVYAESRGAAPHVITLTGNTFDIIRDQAETYRTVLCKTEATDPIVFALAGNLIQRRAATSSGKPPELSLGSGRGTFRLASNWASAGLLKCASNVAGDRSTYEGWDSTAYPPSPSATFGRQVVTVPPPPPVVPPVPAWVESGRQRVESADTAMEVITYRKAVQ